MDECEAAEIVRSRWFEDKDRVHSEGIVTLGVCPFCGKGDRIGLLPDPAEMGSVSDDNYSAAWERLARTTRSVGFCGFCNNVVLISDTGVLMPGME